MILGGENAHKGIASLNRRENTHHHLKNSLCSVVKTKIKRCPAMAPMKMELHFILLNEHSNKLSSLWKHLESKARNCSKLPLPSQSAGCGILAVKALPHVLTGGDELAAPASATPWDQPCNIQKENLIFLNRGSPPLKIPGHRELSYLLFSSPT